MAPELVRHLAPQGIAILSGLLASQEAEIVETYGDAGLRTVDHIRLGEWSTLLLTY
jgi:ribosomal protein L11 methyltransferase